jgi:polyphosphate kinase
MSAHTSGLPDAVRGTRTAETAEPESQTATGMRPRSSNGQFIHVVPADNSRGGPVDDSEELPEAPADELPEDLPEALPADRFLEREISWLQFNERVLQLAADESTPLLERARYLAIFASNLDEYFMVRVAGLKRRIATGLAVRSASGLEPREVFEEISRLAHQRPDHGGHHHRSVG